ncbi:MAG TPA: alkaline phosphatase family protein [Polyangia bacterium]|nr:alkaline phosphatase family protein [Polyangia bacterium]
MKKSRPAAPRKPSLTRRQALKAACRGLGGLAVAASLEGLEGCGAMPNNRCLQGGAAAAAADGGAAPSPSLATARGLLAGVDHLVVVFMENRSFDHFLGGLSLDAAYPAARALDGIKGDEQNPDGAGQMVKMSLLSGNGTYNPRHDWLSSRVAWNNGQNDGFVRANADQGLADDSQVMTYLDRGHLPFCYGLAGQSTLCERWFSSVMGPTWPNRFYMHAATSNGQTGNLPMGLDAADTIWDRLAEQCLAGKNYYAGGVPWYSVAFPSKSFSGNDAMTPEPIDGFFRDAASGNLPPFSLVDPDFEVNDAHPPHDLALAEAFLSSVHRALVNGPAWARTMLVITFDEHGGFYDHVAPPTTVDADADFRQLGFRVPALVAGPMVRAGRVVSTPFEHVSVAATLRARFGIRSLNARMDAANDLSSCVDPALASAPPASTSAALLPAVELAGTLARGGALHRTSQPEVHRLARRGGTPLHHLDLRSPYERVSSWLRRAQELEAVRVVG